MYFPTQMVNFFGFLFLGSNLGSLILEMLNAKFEEKIEREVFTVKIVYLLCKLVLGSRTWCAINLLPGVFSL